MAGRNPAKAVAAALPLPLSGDGWQVRPMTLGMWAALERIGSPLVGADEESAPKDVLAYIPSLYLLTHDPREVFEGNVLDKAMAWADTVPVHMMALIRDAAFAQMRAANDVIPEEDDDAKKAKAARTTDGSLASRSGRLARFTGAMRRFFGMFQCRRSRS